MVLIIISIVSVLFAFVSTGRFWRLKKQNHRMADAANIGLATISVGENIKIVKLNQGLKRLLGYTETELDLAFKSPDKLFFNSLDQNKFSSLIQYKLIKCELRLRKKDGSSINVLIERLKPGFAFRQTLMICEVPVQSAVQTNKNIAEMFNDIFFKYNFITETLSCSKKLENGIDPVNSCCNFFVIFKGMVHPDDRQKWVCMYEKLCAKKTLVNANLRLTVDSENYHWYMVEMLPVLDNRGKIVKIIGKASDIDEIICETERFKEKALRDPLTGFYNKNATAELINQYLAGEGKDKVHSMLFIDIDNFKYINDNLGHLFGDMVLTEISDKIKKMFRSTDLVGRIGGDEFVILIKDTGSIKTACDKVELIRQLLNKEYYHNDIVYNVTGSIGVAMYPQNGTTYEELIRNADDALYIAKSKGKNRFVVCPGKSKSIV